MKVKALTRSVADHQPPGSSTSKQPRNLDPALHPFERAREYTRALNATKLERMHAKPFVGQMGRGHVDGVYSMAKDPNSLERVASGSGDGIVKVWDVTDREQLWTAPAHDHIVKGMEWTLDGKLLTCAADRTVKLWDPSQTSASPLWSWLGAGTFSSLSRHRSRSAFAAAASDHVAVYDLERHTAAPEVLKWPTSVDSVTDVAFNQVETSVLASCSNDRSLVIYDLRMSTPVTKTVLTFTANRVAWSPMEAFNMAVASEDHNAYLFDTRRMDRALNVYKDHVAAVMDVEFSPTGEGLVTASWDRTVRLWDRNRGHSRDVYHTKRMQRVMAARWTPDARYVLSGSDDGNVRLWRANASDREGVKSARHRQSLEYNKALTERYAHMPELRRISRHRHIPTVIKKAGDIKAKEIKSIKRREENERRHTKKQFERRKNEREKMVITREK
ncbi:DDB1- and CUL4-associated factor 13 [Geosmithia morbida]|uniref:DDB1- and CUL4-associated factor 13 n=1 Tax=Geosmithia morbida TaxID=1094350 RepID=A0A9P4YXP3_9HYPO|nr:DDB1- and CUL4-associated factor 13 [Geosmithia morbida]KAF4123699.1 DDB1- and CUL4-associated factor 13 [Geosmithia morbida]